ncbi:MAG TPA: hypothetical protein V6D14_08985 [Coleofasciculaceae cyanobacterium]
MSQDVSTNQGVREQLTPPPPTKPWSPEAEADKLMDELFGDIDRILEGSNKLPTEPVKPEYVSLQSLSIGQITTPPAVVPPQELPQQPSTEQTEIPTTLVEPSETSVAPTTSSPTNQSGWWSLEKVLLLAGLAALGVTIILLLTNQKKLSLPWSPNQIDSPTGENGQLSGSDAQFVNYMLRSLEVIEHKTKAKPQVTASPTPSGTTNLATIQAPNPRPLAPNPAPSVLYIPVYPPQAPLALSAPPAARASVRVAPLPVRPPAATPPSTIKRSLTVPSPPAKPSLPAPSAAVKRAVPAPSVATKRPAPAPSVAAKRPAPAPSVAARRPAPASSKASASAPTPPPSQVPESSQIPQSSAAAARHTLVGLLELGEQSAALFEVNGITQRINVGEAIGASGWTLVSVANQEAVVRRNGEVRSVYVGQKF